MKISLRLRKPPNMDQNIKAKQKPSNEKPKEEVASKNHLSNTCEQNLNKNPFISNFLYSILEVLWLKSQFLAHRVGWSGKDVRTSVVLLMLDSIWRYPSFLIAVLHSSDFCIAWTSLMSISSRHRNATYCQLFLKWSKTTSQNWIVFYFEITSLSGVFVRWERILFWPVSRWL